MPNLAIELIQSSALIIHCPYKRNSTLSNDRVTNACFFQYLCFVP